MLSHCTTPSRWREWKQYGQFTVYKESQYKLSNDESWAIKFPADQQHCNQR